jgi:hypothetical protein
MTAVPHSALSALVTPLPALAYKNSACGAIVSPSSALTYKNRCPQASGSPFPVPRSRLLGVIHNGVCQSVHVKNRQIRVKIDQNGVKFGSKSDQKRAHFVMPILTFWGVTPSGASARAVFAFRKGKKGAFSGAPERVPKLSTIPWRLWITPGFLFAASRPLSAGYVRLQVPSSKFQVPSERPVCVAVFKLEPATGGQVWNLELGTVFARRRLTCAQDRLKWGETGESSRG